MKSLKIYMVRHGRSRGNREGVYIGWTDTPLDPEGAEQIRAVKTNLPERFDAVYVSPLLRTRQSADILVGPGGYSLCEGIKGDPFRHLGGHERRAHRSGVPQDWEAWQRDWIDTVPRAGSRPGRRTIASAPPQPTSWPPTSRARCSWSPTAG